MFSEFKFKDLEKTSNKNLYLLFLAALVGLAAGFVASLYRLALQEAENYGRSLYHFLVLHPIDLIFLVPALAVLAACVTFFITKYPMSAGSGIPQVKGQLQGYFQPDWRTTAFAKFIAGTLAMFAGLSLGREGPSVQLGASMGQAISEKLAQTERHKRLLIAAGASSGLSAAFNAPLSGTMFALEEIFRYFSPLILLACMTAAVVADAISRLLLGANAIFHFVITDSIALHDYWLLILLGIILGVFGAFYNWSLLYGQRLMKKLKHPYVRVLISFLSAGAMGLAFPFVIGSGHTMIDQLTFSLGFGFLILVLVAKFFISMVSFVSGVPGGIFFPLLVLGASLGSVFATASINLFHLPSSLFANLIILSMAGCFTAIVRAPITGIVLLVEMTGSFNHLLPLAFVSIIAYVVADLLHSKPIYDSLLANMLRDTVKVSVSVDKDKTVTFETIVQFDSPADKKFIRQIIWPKNCLLISIHRNGADLIPKGMTKLHAEDVLTFLVKENYESRAREIIHSLVTEKET